MGGGDGMKFCLRYNNLSFSLRLYRKIKGEVLEGFVSLENCREGIQHTQNQLWLQTPNVVGEDFICLKKDFNCYLEISLPVRIISLTIKYDLKCQCAWLLKGQRKIRKDSHASRLQKESLFRTENLKVDINQWILPQIVAI